MGEPMISERGRALILAAAILDRIWDADPSDDLVIIARQLIRAQEELDMMRRDFGWIKKDKGVLVKWSAAES